MPPAKAAQVIAGSGLLVALVESDSEEESEAVPADHSVPNALPARNLTDVRPYDFAGAPRLRR